MHVYACLHSESLYTQSRKCESLQRALSVKYMYLLIGLQDTFLKAELLVIGLMHFFKDFFF